MQVSRTRKFIMFILLKEILFLYAFAMFNSFKTLNNKRLYKYHTEITYLIATDSRILPYSLSAKRFVRLSSVKFEKYRDLYLSRHT